MFPRGMTLPSLSLRNTRATALGLSTPKLDADEDEVYLYHARHMKVSSA